MRSSGNLLMERIYLQEISLLSEKSLLQNPVRKRIARSFLESGNYERGITVLTGHRPTGGEPENEGSANKNDGEVSPPPLHEIPREDQVLLGQAFLQNNQKEKAIEIFTQLVENTPKRNQPDDFALAGVKGLDQLAVGIDKFGKTAPRLSEEEHFKRAAIYQFNRNFKYARTHYEAIVKNHPDGSRAPISMYQIARGFGQERNYEKAVGWSERLLKEFPEDELAKLALYQAAGNFANLDKTDEAVSRYQKYISENPEADNLERAFLNIIDAFRDAGDNKKALEWAARAQEEFRGEMGEAVALFSQARINISEETWPNALRDLERLSQFKNLGGISIAGGTNKDEVTFLKAFVLEKLGRFDQSVELYLTLDDGLKNYYGGRASSRLRELAENKQTSPTISQFFNKYFAESQEILTDSNADKIKNAAHRAFRLTGNPETKKKLLARISRTYSLLPAYQKIPGGELTEFGRQKVITGNRKSLNRNHRNIADELLFLGLFDEGTPELETALREDLSNNTGSLSDFPPDTAFTLAVFYKRGDLASRAIGFIEPRWKQIPADYQIGLIPRAQLELLYPVPYKTPLLKYGKEKQVDPRFVLSIMRQESRFIAEIKSIAAARGLMQFISSTSLKMAREMKIEDFRQNDLYNPPMAIRFGSHYLKNIFRDFPDQPPAVAASYNGGEDRMMRWYKRSKTIDPDRYVAEVIFTQTKDYVYKVMANYRVYRMLYDEKLKDLK
jgi:soluble lytic murein transglycosylase